MNGKTSIRQAVGPTVLISTHVAMAAVIQAMNAHEPMYRATFSEILPKRSGS
jgi:hypothetical protein